MNQLQLFKRRNYVKNLIRVMNRNKNALKWGSGESDAHIQMKLEICKYLKKQGKEYYTEAILVKSGLRCDIINADDQVIIEVYETETQESLDRKKKLYPLPIIFVKADQPFNEKLLLWK